MNKAIFLLLIFGISLTACQQSNADNKPNVQLFFSLKDYFNQEIKKLEQQAHRLEKTVTLNGQKEVKVFEHIDYHKEFAPFIDNDINRLAWADKYQADSLVENGQLKAIQYQATDISLKTRQINIEFSPLGEVEIVSLQQENNSVLTQAAKKLSYVAQKQYSIHTQETNKTGDVMDIKIEGKILGNE